MNIVCLLAALNLGVPRVATSTMNQGSKQPKNSLNQQQYIPDVPMSFPPPPQSLIFHPRQSSQPAYISSSNSPVNIKVTTSKSGTATTKPTVAKNQVVRPTPKQPPTNHPVSTNNAISTTRLKGEPPVDQVTYVAAPGSSFVLSQKGSTLSKMLMSPATQQQLGGNSSPEQKMEQGEVCGINEITPRTAVPSKFVL